MGLFNSKREDDVPQQDLQELFQRLEHLERKCRRMETRISELENAAASQSLPEKAEDLQLVERKDESAQEIVIPALEEELAHETVEPVEATLFFLPAPTADGMFSQVSDQEQIGKSIYRLMTADGVNGTFILLDTPDAIATAMISVSTFIKPVCKVVGSTSQYPRHIVTEEEGVATREGAGWKVIRKAVVRFE